MSLYDIVSLLLIAWIALVIVGMIVATAVTTWPDWKTTRRRFRQWRQARRTQAAEARTRIEFEAMCRQAEIDRAYSASETLWRRDFLQQESQP